MTMCSISAGGATLYLGVEAAGELLKLLDADLLNQVRICSAQTASSYVRKARGVLS